MAWENEKTRRWVDDESVNTCQQCQEPFTMMVRRHHCRKCGGIFCYTCSSFTLVLPSSNKPQRVCQPCQRGWSLTASYADIRHRARIQNECSFKYYYFKLAKQPNTHKQHISLSVHRLCRKCNINSAFCLLIKSRTCFSKWISTFQRCSKMSTWCQSDWPTLKRRTHQRTGTLWTR